MESLAHSSRPTVSGFVSSLRVRVGTLIGPASGARGALLPSVYLWPLGSQPYPYVGMLGYGLAVLGVGTGRETGVAGRQCGARAVVFFIHRRAGVEAPPPTTRRDGPPGVGS